MYRYDHFCMWLGEHGHGRAKRPAYVGSVTLVRAPAEGGTECSPAKPTAARLHPLHLASG